LAHLIYFPYHIFMVSLLPSYGANNNRERRRGKDNQVEGKTTMPELVTSRLAAVEMATGAMTSLGATLEAVAAAPTKAGEKLRGVSAGHWC
jgi:hypothetical protein